jgi:hypothetical protein
MWKADQGPFINSYNYVSRHKDISLVFEGETLEVTTEVGSGHCKESRRSYIPQHVLFSLLEHAGFNITRKV